MVYITNRYGDMIGIEQFPNLNICIHIGLWLYFVILAVTFITKFTSTNIYRGTNVNGQGWGFYTNNVCVFPQTVCPH